MGYLRPTAIIVTASYDNPIGSGNHWASIAHAKANEIFTRYDLEHLVSELLPETINHTRSFLVAWDGSKEGWEESATGDAARAEFVTWLREQAYDDGSSPLDWVEVQYGGDDQEVIALAHDGERLTV